MTVSGTPNRRWLPRAQLICLGAAFLCAFPAFPQVSRDSAGAGNQAITELEQGLGYYRRRDLARAVTHLSNAVRLNPELIRAHAYLGHACFYLRRWPEAIAALEQALSLDRRRRVLGLLERRVAVDNLGMAHALNGDLRRAREIFQEAIREDPNYPLFHYNLACTLSELGDTDQALASLETALRLRPHLAPGESLPDPQQDDSFRRLAGDIRFQKIAERYAAALPSGR